jgi:ribosome-binding factor A
VYYTVLPDTPEERERTAAGIRSAVGLLRRDLGQALHVRKVPELVFEFDDVADSGRRIDAILADLALPDEDDDPDAAGDPPAPGEADAG